MKQYLKSSMLPAISLATGILTMLMRFWLIGLGRDDHGLLCAGNFPDVVSWILTALMMGILFLGTWNLNEAAKYSFNFPASVRAAFGILLGALGVLIASVIELFSAPDAITVWSSVLGLLTAPALVFVARCRKTGLRPSILFHGIACIFLMFHLIAHYRLWSGIPQLQSYAFELLAIIFLMLSCYQRAAFDINQGKRRPYAFFSMAALFFCIAAIPGSDNPVFFIGCAAWMYLTPCNLKSLPSKFPKNDA